MERQNYKDKIIKTKLKLHGRLLDIGKERMTETALHGQGKRQKTRRRDKIRRRQRREIKTRDKGEMRDEGERQRRDEKRRRETKQRDKRQRKADF